MKISVITICYNNETEIRQTIESVVCQTHDDLEYIVVDGASKDGSLAIINEYKDRITKIISEPDKGIYDAINKGIRNATGDIVGMIHAGDQLHDNQVLERVAHFFEANDVDLSYGHSKIVNSNGVVKRINKSPEFNRNLAKRGWMPSHQSCYVKREVYEKYGLYRMGIGSGAADYEWFVRYFYVHGNEIKIKLLDSYIVKFTLGGTSSSNYRKRAGKAHRDTIKSCWSMNNVPAPCGIVYMMWFRKIKQFILAKILK